MATPTDQSVTQLLDAASTGDAQAAADLLPLVYSELRRLAQSQMARTPPGNTLQPTALVHEAYLRLLGRDEPCWNGRGHFFGAAAQAMRQILVEQARRKASARHGGGKKRMKEANRSRPDGPRSYAAGERSLGLRRSSEAA
ncbi:MAG: ECF-type sigma factor [Planctomycetota bacterium]